MVKFSKNIYGFYVFVKFSSKWQGFMGDFSNFTGVENVSLMIELDWSLLACDDVKHRTQSSERFPELLSSQYV